MREQRLKPPGFFAPGGGCGLALSSVLDLCRSLDPHGQADAASQNLGVILLGRRRTLPGNRRCLGGLLARSCISDETCEYIAQRFPPRAGSESRLAWRTTTHAIQMITGGCAFWAGIKHLAARGGASHSGGAPQICGCVGFSCDCMETNASRFALRAVHTIDVFHLACYRLLLSFRRPPPTYRRSRQPGIVPSRAAMDGAKTRWSRPIFVALKEGTNAGHKADVVPPRGQRTTDQYKACDRREERRTSLGVQCEERGRRAQQVTTSGVRDWAVLTLINLQAPSKHQEAAGRTKLSSEWLT